MRTTKVRTKVIVKPIAISAKLGTKTIKVIKIEVTLKTKILAVQDFPDSA